MTDFEILQAILDEIKGVKNEIQDFKKDVNSRLDNLENDNKAIHAKLDNLENDNKAMHEKFDSLEKEVRLNTTTLETTVKQCIDTLGEGYQANFEKIDSLNIDSMKSKITQLELLYKFHTKEIESLKLKIS